MNVSRFTLIGLLASLLSLMPFASTQAENLLPPQHAIEVASTQLQKKLQDKSFTKDFSKITEYVREVIYPHTDFDRISALVLGKLWKQQVTTNVNVLNKSSKLYWSELIRGRLLSLKNGRYDSYPLEMEADATKVVVKTQVLQPGIQPIAVDYRMVLHDGEWKAYDIMIEGVSLVTNYRTTFSNEVQTKGSLNAVIDGLTKRNAEALAAKPSNHS